MKILGASHSLKLSNLFWHYYDLTNARDMTG
jgi:hypothetical protein